METKVTLRTVNFFDLLGLMFIYLKLTNQIDWTWFWVLSPSIIGLCITFTIMFATIGILWRKM